MNMNRHASGVLLLISPSPVTVDGIEPSVCSLSYTTVDDVAAIVAQIGTRALLAKVIILLKRHTI